MPAGKFDVCVFLLYFSPAMCLIQHSHKISYKLHIALFLSLFLRRFFFFVFVIFRWTKNAFIHTFCHGLICSTFWYSNGIVGDSSDESKFIAFIEFPIQAVLQHQEEEEVSHSFPSFACLVCKNERCTHAFTHLLAVFSLLPRQHSLTVF